MTKIKLTQTQREVLIEAASRSTGYVGIHATRQHVGRPGSDSYKTHGQRKLAAIRALVSMGFLDGYNAHHHSDYPPCAENLGGWPIYSTEVVAYITEAGREAIR